MLLVQVEKNATLGGSGANWPRPLADSQAPRFRHSGELERELRQTIRGEVRFDDGSRGLYASDGSNYRQIPIGVVIPRDADDVEAAVAACRRFEAPILSRGGGTSLAGQCCNTAVVMDMSKYMYHVLDIDRDRRLARVQPGCVLDRLRHQAEQYQLTFGPDPATHDHCTLGGMVGNNSCGVHSQMAGRTADNIEELEILTYDGVRMRVGRTNDSELQARIDQGGRVGEIYRRLRDLRDHYAEQIRERFPRIPRRVSGYNLDELLPGNGFHVARALVGTESTCVTVLEIVANLMESPQERVMVVLGYPDVFQAADHVPEVTSFGPIGCEGIDERLLDYYRHKGLHLKDLKLMPEGHGWLIVEFGGQTLEEARDRAHACMDGLKKKSDAPTMCYYERDEREHAIWEVRESSLGATAFVPDQPDTWPGWEDSAVHPERLGGYLRELRSLFDRYNYHPSVYGHFGQGCVHCRVPFDLVTAEGIANWKSFMDEATSLVVRHGGSLSGEHGDGQSRAQFLGKMFGEDLLEAFREFKSIWDPDWKMNPGKVVDPYPIDVNLRLGTTYNPPNPDTHFAYPADQFNFARSALRCVGVGKCRREDGGTMCPSYMVTREEMHSTRGRARLLFEMLQGDPVSGGWRDEHVKDALDLCLSCKGCKGDCPVGVDMATYKAEFLSHYYEGRVRPRHAYASGLIFLWARLASRIPQFANLFTQTPGLSAVAKFAAGYAQERSIPKFASQSFQDWWSKRPLNKYTGKPVILWADTFNNYFTPEVAKAAVDVLEAGGYRVHVPRQSLCCGRPLYDYGMLTTAKQHLLRILDALDPAIREGVPVVVLEPSCASVFRDEAVNLLYGNLDLVRLQTQTFTLSEFLQSHADAYEPPRLERHALVHGHCHHKSVLDFKSEPALLRRMGLELNVPETGCCGMAGSFGYEEEHYEVGLRCGERKLLPEVRKTAKENLIIADGFSCREMIKQETDREALHTAQVLQMALHEGPAGPSHELKPESDYPAVESAKAVPTALALTAGAAVLAAAGVLLLRNGKGNR